VANIAQILESFCTEIARIWTKSVKMYSKLVQQRREDEMYAGHVVIPPAGARCLTNTKQTHHTHTAGHVTDE